MSKGAAYDRVIFTCMTHQRGAAEAMGRATWDWEEFVTRASAHGVLPAVEVAGDVTAPEEVRELLDVVRTANTERNGAVLRDLVEAASALNEIGIEPVALKGLAGLLIGLYGDVGRRHLGDIDLLVPADRIREAVAVLERLGYSSGGELHPIEAAIGHSFPEMTRAGSLDLDLHRSMGLGKCARMLTAEETMREGVRVELNGAIVRVPRAEHLVTHHILHSQLHDSYYERIWPSLRGVYDFLLYRRHFGEQLDWGWIERRFQQWGEAATLALYLRQIERMSGEPVPIRVPWDAGLRVRWARRRLLARVPSLRFVDPVYFYFAGWKPRTRRVAEILRQPGWAGYLAAKFTSRRFYDRLRRDFS